MSKFSETPSSEPGSKSAKIFARLLVVTEIARIPSKKPGASESPLLDAAPFEDTRFRVSAE